MRALAEAARTRTFWALAGGFAICGATTNGLIGTHFVPSAHDHGMPETTAAGLLALVGIFDIAGTVVSGVLTDRIDPRLLLVCYYFFRGVGLLVLPWLLSDAVHPSMLLFIIIYGLDWVATVPPTAALCREAFGTSRNDRVRLGVRLAPDRGGRRLRRGGDHPRHDRPVHSRLVRRSWPLLSGGHRVGHDPESPARQRVGQQHREWSAS